MPGIVKLSIKEANDLISQIETGGGNADGLKAAVNDVGNPANGHTSVPTTNIVDEEWLEEKRRESAIEYGTDLECMMCHDKFDHLICGTCEVCFREWMLPLKPIGRSKKLL